MKLFKVVGTYSKTITKFIKAEDATEAENIFCNRCWRENRVAGVDEIISIDEVQSEIDKVGNSK